MPRKNTQAKPAVSKKKSPSQIGQPASSPEFRLYWLIYNVALSQDVEQLLEECRIEAYTAWKEVIGAGRSGPHLNDDVWPGVNALFMFAAPQQLEAQLAAGIEKIRREFPHEGIKLIVQPCSGIY